MTESVYLIGDPASNLAKVGRSTRVPQRLIDLQRTHPLALEVRWQMEGGCTLENALHRHFKDRREYGEWFRFPEPNAVEIVNGAATQLKAELITWEALLAKMDAEAARTDAEDAARVAVTPPGIRLELVKQVRMSHAASHALERMIVEECAAGRSARDVAAESGKSHEWVRQLIRGKLSPGRKRRIA